MPAPIDQRPHVALSRGPDQVAGAWIDDRIDCVRAPGAFPPPGYLVAGEHWNPAFDRRAVFINSRVGVSYVRCVPLWWQIWLHCDSMAPEPRWTPRRRFYEILRSTLGEAETREAALERYRPYAAL